MVTLARRFADLYDTKLMARHLPAVFDGDTSLGQVYDAIVSGSRREQARVSAVLMANPLSAAEPKNCPVWTVACWCSTKLMKTYL